MRAQLATTIAIVVGWAFLTWSLAEIVRPDVVWRASIGIFFLSLAGWKLLYVVAVNGLYKLTRPKKNG